LISSAVSSSRFGATGDLGEFPPRDVLGELMDEVVWDCLALLGSKRDRSIDGILDDLRERTPADASEWVYTVSWARYAIAIEYGLTSLLDPPPSSSIKTELLFPFPFPDFLALIVTSGDSTGFAECQLPGRLACRLFGLFFKVDGRDLGLDGLDLVGDFDFRGEGLRATGDFLADNGIGVGVGVGRNGILTRE
jgi:hypothetical protein